MRWEIHPNRCRSSTPTPPRPRYWIIVGWLLWSLVPLLHTLGGDGKPLPQQLEPPQDPCQLILQQSLTDLQHLLDRRLRHGFPATAQLDEGNARLSPLAIRHIDCVQRHVLVSGSYEFRGNLGVMDITRRGTTVLQLRLSPKLEQRQVWLDAPEVVEVTFDNPAPWFDGKAISNWVLALFADPVCASLLDGQAC
jgi:hypothetical protein